MQRREAIVAALGFAAFDPQAHAEPVEPREIGTVGSRNFAAATSLERAAGIGRVDPSYPPGDVRRYGAQGNGSADDSAAWCAAVSTGHRVLGGGPECRYAVHASVPITRSTVIDMQHATIKPVGDTQVFVRNTPAPTARTIVLRGAVQGSRTIEVGGVSGFLTGQWLRLSLNDFPQHDASSYPPSWTRIVAASGSALEFGTPLQIDYGKGGEPTAALAYDHGAFLPQFECRNGIFDGSECTFDIDTGQAIRVSGFERVVVENCEFQNFTHGGQLTCPVEIFTNIDALVRGCRFVGGVSKFDCCDIQEARFAHFLDNFIEGSHFGCNVTRVDYGLMANNSLHGQRALEAAHGLWPPRSVRGLKAYGCTAIRILGNHASDYESPIKVEACFRYDVSHNVVFNGGLSPFSGQIALNVGSIIHGRNMRGGIIAGNHVEMCGGVGIGVSSDPPGGVLISGNVVRSTHGSGIYVAVPRATVVGNRVEDWALSGGQMPAIHFLADSTIADNRFANTASNTAPCLGAVGRGPGRGVVRDNVSETDNPYASNALVQQAFLCCCPKSNLYYTRNCDRSHMRGGLG
jgi:hypothetical protein